MFLVITFNAAGGEPNGCYGAVCITDQMDYEVLRLLQGPIPHKAIINFSELHQFRDILYGQIVRETVI